MKLGDVLQLFIPGFLLETCWEKSYQGPTEFKKEENSKDEMRGSVWFLSFRIKRLLS